MKIIFLIGPSDVGKTTLAKELSNHLDDIMIVELDNEVKKEFPEVDDKAGENWEGFWNASLSCIQNLTIF